MDISLTPPEILEIFSAAGVVSVYRCTRLVDNKRVPTESIIATFAGTACLSGIKAWPLIINDHYNVSSAGGTDTALMPVVQVLDADYAEKNTMPMIARLRSNHDVYAMRIMLPTTPTALSDPKKSR